MGANATKLSVGPRVFHSGVPSVQRHRSAGSPVRILSIDGGGIRGIIPLQLLMRLEQDTKHRVQDLFDLIVGTSTGGIIAMALVELQWSPEQCMRFYREQVTTVFARNRLSAHAHMLVSGSRYSSQTMNQLIQSVCQDGDNSDREVTSFSTGPRAIAVACNVGQHVHCPEYQSAVAKGMAETPHSFRPSPFLFRNFQTLSSIKGSNVFRVWEAMRATSAAPTYWDPCVMLDRHGGRILVDGGVGNNNPTLLAFLEARTLWQVEPLQTEETRQLKKRVAVEREKKRAAAAEQAQAAGARPSDSATGAASPAQKGPTPVAEQALPEPMGAGLLNPATKIGVVLSLGTGVKDEAENVRGGILSEVGWLSDSLTTGEMMHEQCAALFVGKDMPAYFRFQPHNNSGSTGLDETNPAVLQALLDTTDAYLAQEPVRSRLRYLTDLLRNPDGSADVENAEALARHEARTLLGMFGEQGTEPHPTAAKMANLWDRS